MLSKSLSSKTNLFKTNRKFYNGIFERPTQSILSHLTVIGLYEAVKFTNNFMPWTYSIALVSSMIRLAQIPTYYLIKDIKLRMFENSFLTKWKHNLILNDTYIDIKRRKLDQSALDYYSSGLVGSYILQAFLLLNNFRMLFSISQSPGMYPNFNSDTVLGLNLATYDPYFIFPIIVFFNNFLLLNVSNHPWLVNYSYSKLLYLSFFLSIGTIFVPKCYCISWIAYTLTHVLILKLSNYAKERRRLKEDYTHLLSKRKKHIEEYYKH